MNESTMLSLDVIGNILLGVLLMVFPAELAQMLGVPPIQSTLYSSILGGLLIGIGVALFVERFKNFLGITGLGLGGAISINTCFAIVLGLWLVSNGMNLSTFGYIILWGLVVVLFGFSFFEFLTYTARRRHSA
jgi:hypothetical protein